MKIHLRLKVVAPQQSVIDRSQGAIPVSASVMATDKAAAAPVSYPGTPVGGTGNKGCFRSRSVGDVGMHSVLSIPSDRVFIGCDLVQKVRVWQRVEFHRRVGVCGRKISGTNPGHDDGAPR